MKVQASPVLRNLIESTVSILVLNIRTPQALVSELQYETINRLEDFLSTKEN